MESVRDYIEKVRARLMREMEGDKARTTDPIIGRFMEGRVVIEKDYLETLDNILDMLKES